MTYLSQFKAPIKLLPGFMAKIFRTNIRDLRKKKAFNLKLFCFNNAISSPSRQQI